MNDKRIEEMQAQITALQNELNTMKQLSQCDVPVTERIKTFEDACLELGEDNVLVKQYNEICSTFNYYVVREENPSKDIIAYLKLRIIAAALNEDWKPTFTKNECRYYSYFELYTKEEYDCRNEEWKQKHPLQLLDASATCGAYCGIIASFSGYTQTPALPGFSSCVAVKSPELAIYFGTQFFEIWKDYIFKQSKELNLKNLV